MTQHIVIRKEEFVAGTTEKPETMVFTQTARKRRPVPWDRIEAGDVVWMKWSGGPIVAKGTVEEVVQMEECTPKELREAVRGSLLHDLEEYWQSLPQASFGMAIFCTAEQWLDHLIFPSAQGYMSSWIVLDTPEKEKAWLTNTGEDVGKGRQKGGRSRTIPNSLRFVVLRRDGFSCTYCAGRLHDKSLPEQHLLQIGVIPGGGEAFVLHADL